MNKRNFTATQKEPAGPGPNGVVNAIAIEFDASVKDLPSNGLLLFLRPEVTMEEATELRSMLNRFGDKWVAAK